MDTIITKVKKWGNSFGIVLPKKILDKENIKEGSEIEISIKTKNKTKAKDIFGILKDVLKKGDTEKILKRIDKDFEKK